MFYIAGQIFCRLSTQAKKQRLEVKQIMKQPERHMHFWNCPSTKWYMSGFSIFDPKSSSNNTLSVDGVCKITVRSFIDFEMNL